MEPIAVLAVGGVVTGVVDAAAVVALPVSVAVAVLTGRQAVIPWLGQARAACVVLSGLLVASTFTGAIDRWALVPASLAFLISLQAIALAFGQLAPLRSYLERRTADGEPMWWIEFEKGFRRHTARHGDRDTVGSDEP
jgi:hypothetical protein